MSYELSVNRTNAEWTEHAAAVEQLIAALLLTH